MSSSAFASAPSASTPDRSFADRIARWRHLTLVLWVSFSLPVLTSLYYLLGGTTAIVPTYQHFRLLGGLISEATGLLVLWYVLTSQRKTWRDIGWSPSWADLPRALGLFLATTAATWVAYIPAEYLYKTYSGAFLTPKSLNSILPFEISALSIAYACVNPFFEELIVRAYTMSELANLGANRAVAIAVSVAVQLSYHLYQGLARVVVLAVVFTISAIYYSRTRRILPIILVHLASDLSWLLKTHL